MNINYTIYRSDGTVYATIPNNVILGPNQPGSNPVPLNLVGRNKVGYGQAWNENFLHLVEHFSGSVAPRGNVKGQIWYRNTGATGELLISLLDNARQPEDTVTEAEWASIPMISVFNTIPDGENSVMGRMVLTSNGDSLRVLMKNKEWREIQTSRPENKEYSTLLDINYDTGKKYIEFTQSVSTKPLAYFNMGGTSQVDEDNWTTFTNGTGVFEFGSNYFYELKIMIREVSDATGSVVSLPYNSKTFMIKGQFYVDNQGTFVPGSVGASSIPDPRRITQLESIKDVITSSRPNWDVNIVINGVDSTIPNPNGVTKADYENWVINSLNSNKNLGFRIDGSISNLVAGESVKLQASVLLNITGIPLIGV